MSKLWICIIQKRPVFRSPILIQLYILTVNFAHTNTPCVVHIPYLLVASSFERLTIPSIFNLGVKIPMEVEITFYGVTTDNTYLFIHVEAIRMPLGSHLLWDYTSLNIHYNVRYDYLLLNGGGSGWSRPYVMMEKFCREVKKVDNRELYKYI